MGSAAETESVPLVSLGRHHAPCAQVTDSNYKHLRFLAGTSWKAALTWAGVDMLGVNGSRERLSGSNCWDLVGKSPGLLSLCWNNSGELGSTLSLCCRKGWAAAAHSPDLLHIRLLFVYPIVSLLYSPTRASWGHPPHNLLALKSFFAAVVSKVPSVGMWRPHSDSRTTGCDEKKNQFTVIDMLELLWLWRFL